MVGLNGILLDIFLTIGNLAFPVGLARHRSCSICGSSRQSHDCLPVDSEPCRRRAIGRRPVPPPLTPRHHHRLRSHQHPYHQRQFLDRADDSESGEGKAGSVCMRELETGAGRQMKTRRKPEKSNLPGVGVVPK